MKITILKAGILDTIQDKGRFGFQQFGINPGGVMDSYAMQVANFLAGNNADAPVIELHFPSSSFLFNEPSLFSLTGADFCATLNGDEIDLWHPVQAQKNDVLQFHKPLSGARCYLAIHGSIGCDEWLGSCSTNLKARRGGFRGRQFQKGDVIQSARQFACKNEVRVLPWKAGEVLKYQNPVTVRFLPGPEWNWLNEQSRKEFEETVFVIGKNSDRMGFRLGGSVLMVDSSEELVSSAVTSGTVQCLPGGMPLVLMADHQTTGGYPRIAQVITTDLRQLSQCSPGDRIRFIMTDQSVAEKLLFERHRHLLQIQNACTFRIEQFLEDGRS